MFLRKLLSFTCRTIFSFMFLGPQQFGFMRGKSCISQLLSTINDWHSSLGKGKDLDCVYVNFHKAFDSVVSIPKVLLKLSVYGIGAWS